MTDRKAAPPVSGHTEEVYIGLDTRTIRELRTLILDESVEIPLPQRVAGEDSRDWNEGLLMEYGGWLYAILDISPENGDKPLSVVQIDGAARLGLGPNRDSMRKVLDNGATDLQEGLGWIARDRYKLWTRGKCIDEGKALAARLGRRPGTQQFDAAHSVGKFLSVKQIIHRFESMQNFQELIGRPSVRGWSADDHTEWGAAVKRQNGGDFRITSTHLRKLSAEGKGPNYKALSKHFSSLSDFNAKAYEEYQMQIDIEEQDREFWRDEAKSIVAVDEKLAATVINMDEAELLRTVAHYHLIDKLMPKIEQDRQLRAAQKSDSDYVATWIVRNDLAITMAQVENTASMIRVFNILWPMYRFQNVELKLAA